MREVLFEVKAGVARITLNRPQALNALNLAMVQAIACQLGAWVADETVFSVLIAGAGGRGLCAGGDIRAVYDAAKAGMPIAAAFFAAEYRLNAQIAEYPKPIVALMDGLVMGGGVGISAHASHRVVTERTSLAMPEVGIGFFPDVGTSFLLSRPAIGELGTHIALAAPRLAAADVIRVRLADLHLRSDNLRLVAACLEGRRGGAEIRVALGTLASEPAPGVLHDAGWIGACYDADRVGAIVERLDCRAEPAAAEAARSIRGKSPISLKQTLRMLRTARHLPHLRACLEREYAAALRITAMPDFLEGVRATVVDKDRGPRWSVDSVDGISDEAVAKLFPETDDALFA